MLTAGPIIHRDPLGHISPALGGGVGTGVHPSSVTPKASESTGDVEGGESVNGVTALATALTSLALALAVLATIMRQKGR
jgi:hypothetical protein